MPYLKDSCKSQDVGRDIVIARNDNCGSYLKDSCKSQDVGRDIVIARNDNCGWEIVCSRLTQLEITVGEQ